MIWEKYKWYILGYVLYVSIVLASIWNERREFWPLFIIWCITIPVALYIIGSLVSKYLMTNKRIAKASVTVVNNTSHNSNTIADTDLVRTWPLVDFAQEHGKMQVGDFTNRVTGKTSKSCIFTDKDGKTLNVSFYYKLGVLTPQQIKEKRDSLKVGLLITHKYVLYEEW